MTHLEEELGRLRNSVIEMMLLARSQLAKAKEAFLQHDTGLAQEIIRKETRINGMELAIDRDCENILALFNPVATDLRFVVSMLKINSDIERIGDYAESIADYVIEMPEPFKPEFLDRLHIGDMFEIAVRMVEQVTEGYRKGDTLLVRKVFNEDQGLNRINRAAPAIITELIQQNLGNTSQLLYLFSTIKKLERVGDHVKNIAEDIIFYFEAEVLKHRR
ncbi:MAG: phosphate transport system regulatory protein PhoU [Chitinophagales bacterium]|nr:MAG: phosphate transport system regulatory protein PhoU [Chitinophagales bacterium]